jgi:dolichol-phosphate mannosyltransferase
MYNEEAGAEACIRTVCRELRELPNRTDLIVVNDGSADGTGQMLANLLSQQTWRFTVVNHIRNCGYGAALRSGVEEAARNRYDYVLYMDSDLTNDPRDIPKFAAMMECGADVIKATRYSLGGGVSGVPLYRVLISKLGNRLARLLYGLPVHDCTNGFRSSKVSVLTQMNLTENRFPIIMEELYWAKFLARNFAEVPIVLTNRTSEQRKTSFVYDLRVFYDYLKYPIRARLGIRPRGMPAEIENFGR